MSDERKRGTRYLADCRRGLSGPRSPVSGPRSPVPGLRSPVPRLRSPVAGPRSHTGRRSPVIRRYSLRTIRDLRKQRGADHPARVGLVSSSSRREPNRIRDSDHRRAYTVVPDTFTCGYALSKIAWASVDDQVSPAARTVWVFLRLRASVDLRLVRQILRLGLDWRRHRQAAVHNGRHGELRDACAARADFNSKEYQAPGR